MNNCYCISVRKVNFKVERMFSHVLVFALILLLLAYGDVLDIQYAGLSDIRYTGLFGNVLDRLNDYPAVQYFFVHSILISCVLIYVVCFIK